MANKVTLRSRREVDGKRVEAIIIDGQVMCGSCSQPTIHMKPARGTEEGYCPKCHLSFVAE